MRILLPRKGGKPTNKDIETSMNVCLRELWPSLFSTDFQNARLSSFVPARKDSNGSIEFSRKWLDQNSILRDAPHTIYTDVRLNQIELAAEYNKTHPNDQREKLFGLTEKSDPGRNYAAYDAPLSTALGRIVGSEIVATQIHEIANSIEYIMQTAAGNPNARDTDAGDRFEKCVLNDLRDALSKRR